MAFALVDRFLPLTERHTVKFKGPPVPGAVALVTGGSVPMPGLPLGFIGSPELPHEVLSRDATSHWGPGQYRRDPR